MYTLDTNSIIYFLNDDPATVPVLQNIFAKQVPLYVSAITEIELFSFSKLTPFNEQQIDSLLRTVSLIAVDSRLARIAGLIRKTYNLEIADSVIAATALFTGSILLTRNVRDFQKIPNLKLQKI